jgi:DNA ligase 1
VRTLIQNLRVGANWRSVVRALGHAAAIHSAQQASATSDNEHGHAHSRFPTKQELTAAADAAVEAFHSCPSLSKIVEVVQLGGVAGLASLGASVGVPVKPMLAKITTGVEDCVKQTAGKPVLVEYKYDGQRAQIHVSTSGQVSTNRCALCVLSSGVVVSSTPQQILPVHELSLQYFEI